MQIGLDRASIVQNGPSDIETHRIYTNTTSRILWAETVMSSYTGAYLWCGMVNLGTLPEDITGLQFQGLFRRRVMFSGERLQLFFDREKWS